jgi:hypothetical protein
MRLLLVGLDGLSLSSFAGADMPFLRALATQGVQARLKLRGKPYAWAGPVWASVQTGLAPDEHGVTGARVADWHTAAFKQGVETIWRALNEKGLTCGLVNFPVTYPAQPVQRYVICGFPAPWEPEVAHEPGENTRGRGPLFWPEEVGRHVGTFRSAWTNYAGQEQFKDAGAPCGRTLERDRQARRRFMGLLYRSLHETAGLTYRLMRECEVDLLAPVFTETDAVGRFGASLPDDERQAFLNEADEVVRGVFSQAQPDNVIVISTPGCGGGAHSREGVFIACGPAFGLTQDAVLGVLNVAPTVLYAMGAHEGAGPREPAHRLLAAGRRSEQESEGIRQRLRAMGCVG